MDSITFTKNELKKNTFTDWGLIPIGPVDPPFLSDDKVRYGAISFMMKFGDIPVMMRTNDIEEFFSDGSIGAEFSTNPGYIYTGKWEHKVTDTIATGVKVELAYVLDEFKWETKTTKDKWEWNDFDFDEGMVSEDVFTDIEATDYTKFMPIAISKEDLKAHLGDAKVTPTFNNKSEYAIFFKYKGNEYKVPAGKEKSFDDFTIDPDEDIDILVKGKGLYDIVFTKGVR